MQQLPAELVHDIIRCAARGSVLTDREWVVQLALVSHFVHELVSPILYHTMVVTSRNHLKIEALTDGGDKSNHIFRAVRHLVADDWLDLWEEDRLCSLFFGVTSIDASLLLVRVLSQNTEFRPLNLAVRYGRLVEIPKTLPASTLAGVTHLASYIPEIYRPGPGIADKFGNLVDAMPALTHVAVEVLSLTDSDSNHSDSELDNVHDAIAFPLDLAALEHTLRGTLQHPRIRSVAVRVAAYFLPQWAAVLDVMMQLEDTRLFAWQDTRRIRTWEQEERLAAADAMAGRSIWTNARQVYQADS